MYIFIIILVCLAIFAYCMQVKENNTIVNCKACGGKISKRAKFCPHCGAKPSAQMMSDALGGCGCGLLLVPIIIVLAVFIVVLNS